MSSAVVVVGALRVKDKGVFFVMAFEDLSDICGGRILILRQNQSAEGAGGLGITRDNKLVKVLHSKKIGESE